MPKARTAWAQSHPTPAPRGFAVAACDGGQGFGGPAAEAEETAAIRRHMPLVKRLAMHMRGRLPESVQLDDLIQAGSIAVLRILRNRDAAAVNDARLRRTIVNAMIDEARREAWAPVRTVRLAKAAVAAMRAVKRRTGRDGSDEEIAAEMGIAVAEYQRALVEIAGIRLLQLDAFDESAEEKLQIAGSQETSLHRSRMMAALADAIAALPQREKLVVSLYYEHELNMEEVGKVLGLDKSTVCRAHGRALLMLRNALGDSPTDRVGPWSATGD